MAKRAEEAPCLGYRLVFEFKISDGKFSNIFPPASDGAGRCEAKGKPRHSISCSQPGTGMFYLCVYRTILQKGMSCGLVNVNLRLQGPSRAIVIMLHHGQLRMISD